MNVLCSEVDAESKNLIVIIQLYTIHEILSNNVHYRFAPLSVNTTVNVSELRICSNELSEVIINKLKYRSVVFLKKLYTVGYTNVKQLCVPLWEK